MLVQLGFVNFTFQCVNGGKSIALRLGCEFAVVYTRGAYATGGVTRLPRASFRRSSIANISSGVADFVLGTPGFSLVHHDIRTSRVTMRHVTRWRAVQ